MEEQSNQKWTEQLLRHNVELIVVICYLQNFAIHQQITKPNQIGRQFARMIAKIVSIVLFIDCDCSTFPMILQYMYCCLSEYVHAIAMSAKFIGE